MNWGANMKRWLWISIVATLLGLLQSLVVPSYIQPDLALTQMNSESRHFIMSNQFYQDINRTLFSAVCVNWLLYFSVWTYKTYQECKNDE